MDSCAACGKTNGRLKACAACKLVKYCCNANYCQIAHWSEHKKACRKKARELFDLKLFAHPPAREDCPICMLPMPSGSEEYTLMSCCGKIICNGCVHSLTRDVCPCCNTPTPRDTEETNQRLFERIEKFNDANAMNQLGCFYKLGMNGFSIDYSKAAELFRNASELGSAVAHYNLGNSYLLGKGVKKDTEKAFHHYQIAAMMGVETARYNLGVEETNNGNYDRAMKHFMISAKCSHDDSLQKVKEGFMIGAVTKNDFEITLRAHKASQDEMKSDQRESAKSRI